MLPQFGSETNQRISLENVAIGLTIIAIGLFKKSFVADGFALIANPVFQTAKTALSPCAGRVGRRVCLFVADLVCRIFHTPEEWDFEFKRSSAPATPATRINLV